MGETEQSDSADNMKKRLFYRIAETLEKEIRAGIFPVDGKLPTEHEPAAKYKVSRPVIREAILVLEIKGFVEAKVGAGVFVVDNPSNTLSLTSDAGFEDVGPFELMQARQLFESEAAALAALRITRNDLLAMRRILDRENNEMAKQGRSDQLAIIDEEFHMAIANATNNSAVARVVESLWAARRQNTLWGKLGQHLVYTRKDWEMAQRDHEEIYQALAQKSPHRAKQAMARHLKNVRAELLMLTQFEEDTHDVMFFDDVIPENWEEPPESAR